jgi:PKD repeat protein
LVTVSASPNVTIPNSVYTICANNPQPVTITATGANMYSWTGPAGFTATGASITVTPTATSVYTVTGTNTAGGCAGTAVASVTVRNLVAGFTANPDPLNLNTANIVQFTSTSTVTPSPIPTYSWNFGDPGSGISNTSPQQHPQHAYFDPGTYTVTLTVTQGGCTSTFSKQLVVDYIMGLQQALDKGQLKIYPNPAQNVLTIEATSGLQVSEIVLTNAIGQQVKVAKPVSEKAAMDLSDLANGIYFVRVTGKDGSITKKISVIK